MMVNDGLQEQCENVKCVFSRNTMFLFFFLFSFFLSFFFLPFILILLFLLHTMDNYCRVSMSDVLN